MKSDEIAARRERVSTLLLGHHSVRAIAAAMHVPPTTVHRDVVALRREWQAHRLEASTQVVSEELQRLMVAEKAIWSQVTSGEVQAIDRLLKIMERRAKLMGLDAPIQVDALIKQEAELIAAETGLDSGEVIAEIESILSASKGGS